MLLNCGSSKATTAASIALAREGAVGLDSAGWGESSSAGVVLTTIRQGKAPFLKDQLPSQEKLTGADAEYVRFSQDIAG